MNTFNYFLFTAIDGNWRIQDETQAKTFEITSEYCFGLRKLDNILCPKTCWFYCLVEILIQNYNFTALKSVKYFLWS